MTDGNRRKRVALTVLSAIVAGLGLLAERLTTASGLTSLAYATAFVPPAVATLAAATGRGRPVVIATAAIDLLIQLPLLLFGAIWVMPSVGVLMWAAAVPSVSDRRHD